MLDWHKALATVRHHQKRHHQKAARRNKKGFEGQDRYHYTYVRQLLELGDRIKEVRSLLTSLERIDQLRNKKEKPRNKLAGRNRLHGI
jgi:uncharacterized membrane protein YgaE (UPF0421/DUF939 family)